LSEGGQLWSAPFRVLLSVSIAAGGEKIKKFRNRNSLILPYELVKQVLKYIDLELFSQKF